MLERLKRIFGNRWVKFSLATVGYTLWFVVWTGNLWMLLGVVVLFDIYITKVLKRYVWGKPAEAIKRNPLLRSIFDWVDALLFATVLATLIHIFFFAMYVIPSSSMEKSLLIGDYLYVSKAAYGPQMPNTPLSFPFVHHTMPFSNTKKSFSEAVKWPYHRLKGLRKVERNDVVVFNFPAGDTVLLENQNISYYSALSDYQQALGPERGRERLYKDYTVISRPVDKRENYIKRCVGIPGDTIEIVHSQLYVNGRPQQPAGKVQHQYAVTTNGTPISRNAFEEMGISTEDISYNPYTKTYTLPLDAAMLERIAGMGNIVEVTPYESVEYYDQIFPNDSTYRWTEDNFGPLWVPAKGATVSLTLQNLPLYRRIIETYEGNRLEVKQGRIYINGAPADSYTFAMDYFFMMGDNRHNSADSRFWGFVPEDHIVGRAAFIWLSLDKEKRFPKNIRWDRMFRKVE